MNWMTGVGDLLQRYQSASPTTPPQTTQADFANVAQAAPASTVAGGLAAAFRSQQTPSFGEMVSQLFSQSNANQQAGILNHLISAAGPAGLSGGLLGELSGLLGGKQATVTPQQAQSVAPETVRTLAEHAQQRDPSIVERASEFYAQHPTLVKGLGAVALAVAMSHMSRHR
jgi:hypothetical protein